MHSTQLLELNDADNEFYCVTLDVNRNLVDKTPQGTFNAFYVICLTLQTISLYALSNRITVASLHFLCDIMPNVHSLGLHSV